MTQLGNGEELWIATKNNKFGTDSTFKNGRKMMSFVFWKILDTGQLEREENTWNGLSSQMKTKITGVGGFSSVSIALLVCQKVGWIIKKYSNVSTKSENSAMQTNYHPLDSRSVEGEKLHGAGFFSNKMNR